MLHNLKRLFQHSGVYLLGNIFNRIGAFLLLPLYTKYLAVAEYGVLEMLYATMAVVSVLLSAGLSHTTLRFYFDYAQEKDRHAVVTTNIALILLLAIAGAAAVHAVRVPLSNFLFDTPDFAQAIDICLAIMVLEISTEIGFAYLRAKERSVFYVVLSFARLLLQVGMSIYLVAGHGMGISGVLFANLGSVALGWLVVVGYTLAQCGLRARLSLIAPMLHYSLPIAARALVGVFAMNVDRFLLKEFLTLDAVGIYGLAMKFALLLNFLVAEPFFRAYGPFRFSIIEQEDAGKIQALAVHYLVAGATGVALGVALFTPEALYFMATPAYLDAWHYAPVLLLAMIVTAVSYCFETGILYRKQTRYLFNISFFNLLLKTALNVGLIMLWGIHGAALAYLLANLVQTVMINRVSQRLYPIVYGYNSLFMFVALGAGLYLLSLAVDYRDYWISIPYKLTLVLLYVMILYFADRDTRQLFDKALAYLGRGGGSPGPRQT